MPIASVDQLIAAMAGARQRVPFIKTTVVSGAVVGTNASLWGSLGQPTNGTTPLSTTVCNTSTRGAIYFNQPVAPAHTYLAKFAVMSGPAPAAVELHDRLVHNYAPAMNVTTTQTANVSLVPLLTTDNLQARIGRADYGEVQWWLEHNVASTVAVTATVGYTNNLGVAGTVAVALPVAGATRMAAVGVPGVFIRSIESITLSASMGANSNLAVVATRQIAEVVCAQANTTYAVDWAAGGLPRVHDNACLSLITDNGTTTVAPLTGAVTLVQR